MKDGKIHIDEFFREELNYEQEPLDSADIELFDTMIENRKQVLSPKYLKWLPYIAALSAAAFGVWVIVLSVNTDTVKENHAELVSINIKHDNKQKDYNYKDSMLSLTTVSGIVVKNSANDEADKGQPSPLITPDNTNHSVAEIYEPLPLVASIQAVLNSSLFPPVFAKLKDMPFFHTEPDNSKQGKVNGIQVAVKLGYERTPATIGMQTRIASVELSSNLTDRLYFGIQPGIKIGKVLGVNIRPNLTSYNNQSTTVEMSSNQTFPATYNYYYAESYDSISTSQTLNQNIWELEMPLFIGYRLSKRLSVNAGLKIMYGKLPGIQSKSATYHLKYEDSLLNSTLEFSGATGQALFDEHCHCISDDISGSANPSYNTVRAGYLVGLSYMPVKNILIDLSIHQNSSNLTHVPNADVRRAYNTPALRLTIGYKLSGLKLTPVR